jgi:hypothetical protein
MRHLAAITIYAVVLSLAAPAQAGLGALDRACRKSNRPSATPEMCRCIQRVANDSLTRSERRKAAKFFKDPQRAQNMRQSDRSSDKIMWKKYKVFGQRAREICVS